MPIPPRCFTCGKIIGNIWEEYDRLVKNGEKPEVVCDRFKLKRICCRRMLLTHTDIDEVLLLYPSFPDRVQRIDSINGEFATIEKTIIEENNAKKDNQFFKPYTA